MGQRLIGISGSLIWSKTLVELIFNPCGEFRCRRAQLAKSTLLTSTLVSLESFKVCSGAKERKWGAESNGKLSHLFTSSKTAAWVSSLWKTCR